MKWDDKKYAEDRRHRNQQWPIAEYPDHEGIVIAILQDIREQLRFNNALLCSVNKDLDKIKILPIPRKQTRRQK